MNGDKANTNAKGVLDRLPPYSEEAERGALGCCLIDGVNAVARAVEVLKAGAEAFYNLRHRAVFEVMVQLEGDGKAVDPVTVWQKVKDLGYEPKVGQLSDVLALMEATPSAANLDYYLDIIRQKHLARRVLAVCSEGITQIYEGEDKGNTDAVLDDVERSLLEVSEERSDTSEQGAREGIGKAVEQLEEYHRGNAQLRGLSTGFSYLDKMTCGLGKGQLWIIAARPGMGKTSMAMQLAEQVALGCKVGVAVKSLEMAREELWARMLFCRAQCDFQRFRTGYLEKRDFPLLTKAAAELSAAQIWIDDAPDTTVSALRAWGRRMVRQHGARMIVIDYLQLIRGSNRYNNREAEVAEISRGLKCMAKELAIPVVVGAQVNREQEKERNRKPRLADLRESGAVEQDADVVLMGYAPRTDDDEAESDWAQHNIRENWLVAKQRNGPTGDTRFVYQKSCMRFFEVTGEEEAPEAPRAKAERSAKHATLEDCELPGV